MADDDKSEITEAQLVNDKPETTQQLIDRKIEESLNEFSAKFNLQLNSVHLDFDGKCLNIQGRIEAIRKDISGIQGELVKDRSEVDQKIQTKWNDFSTPLQTQLQNLRSTLASQNLDTKDRINTVTQILDNIYLHIVQEMIEEDTSTEEQLKNTLRKDAEKVISRADNTLLIMLFGITIFQVFYADVVKKTQECTYYFWWYVVLIVLSGLGIITLVVLIFMRILDLGKDLAKINSKYPCDDPTLDISVSDDESESGSLLDPKPSHSSLFSKSDMSNEKFNYFYLLAVIVFGIISVSYTGVLAYVALSSCGNKS